MWKALQEELEKLPDLEQDGLDACLEKDDCARDEDGELIQCDDCPGKKAWEKIFTS